MISKITRQFLIIVFLFLGLHTFSQTEYSFLYDNSGNRTNVNIIEFKTSEVITDSLEIIVTKPPVDFYTDTIDNASLKIYPNPTRGILQIEIETTTPDDNMKIIVYNNSGVLVLKKETKNQSTVIDLSAEPLGIYYMKICISETETSEWKIIKQ